MLTFDQCKYVVHLCQALLVKVAVVDVEEEDDSSNVLTSVEVDAHLLVDTFLLSCSVIALQDYRIASAVLVTPEYQFGIRAVIVLNDRCKVEVICVLGCSAHDIVYGNLNLFLEVDLLGIPANADRKFIITFYNIFVHIKNPLRLQEE